jgi:hypothetical protein
VHLGAYLAGVEDFLVTPTLRATAEWAYGTSDDDEALRRLFIETIARSSSDPALREGLRENARRTRADLARATATSGADDPGFAGDILHLALRGYYLSSLEDPEQWPPERTAELIGRLVTAVSRADPR